MSFTVKFTGYYPKITLIFWRGLRKCGVEGRREGRRHCCPMCVSLS